MKEINLLGKDIPLTKSAQAGLGGALKNHLLEGDMNPVEAVVKAKSLHAILDAFLKDEEVKECVINECDKYGKGETPSFGGAVVQVKNTGTKYDYTDCGDPVHERLREEMESLKARMKAREKELMSLSGPRTVVDDETGEVYTVKPPVKTASLSYSITFKK